MVYPLYQQFICHFITNTIGFVFSVVAFGQTHQPNPLQRYNKKCTFARKSRLSINLHNSEAYFKGILQDYP